MNAPQQYKNRLFSSIETCKTIAYIGLGSNLGDSVGYLAIALEHIAALPGVSILQESSVYLTEPQDYQEQPFFANQVIAISVENTLTAHQLLDRLLAIETVMGRDRQDVVRFGPRCIDLDMLLFGNISVATEKLTLPHPRMHLRAFVMVPLAEIAPDLILPCGKTAQEVLSLIQHTITGKTIFQQ